MPRATPGAAAFSSRISFPSSSVLAATSSARIQLGTSSNAIAPSHPLVIIGARGLRLRKGREDWYNEQEGKPHPGAEYPWGVRRIYPESWIREPRGSLFPLVPEPRKGETVESFFQKIKLTDHASKFSSWEELFTTKTRAMRAKGIKKSKDRRLILSWVEKYRQGVDPGTSKYLLYYPKGSW